MASVVHQNSRSLDLAGVYHRIVRPFGPTDDENPSEYLHLLRQLKTVADYIETFERLSHRIDDLPESFLVGCFINGLKKEIRLEVKLKKSRHLVDAIGLARLVEEKLTLQIASYSTQGVATNSSSSSGYWARARNLCVPLHKGLSQTPHPLRVYYALAHHND